ncbi:hypothetical protein FK85_28350 [Halorubrum saccharovorum]|uniref:Uncharacterized protein n=2 Tax=Haloferacaceae TaxID=1644056 RepID=A0A0F8AUX3_9EURY|nr:hypothetical protein FK85_28350 [Halorubrum saccharovorum]
MMRRDVLGTARRHPALTFGMAGGGFALLYILSEPVLDALGGQEFTAPSAFLLLFVVGGFLGGALVAWLLWERLGGERSPIRGAGIGALVGLLAMPVVFYFLELALVVVDGNPFEPLPGATPGIQLGSDLLMFLLAPLLLGALGVIVTYGGTVIVGALVGFLLARE